MIFLSNVKHVIHVWLNFLRHGLDIKFVVLLIMSSMTERMLLFHISLGQLLTFTAFGNVDITSIPRPTTFWHIVCIDFPLARITQIYRKHCVDKRHLCCILAAQWWSSRQGGGGFQSMIGWPSAVYACPLRLNDFGCTLPCVARILA